MTDDEWSKISGEIAGDLGKHEQSSMAPWGGGLLEKGVEYGGAFARGALKQAALAPGLQHIEPQGIIDWAKEKDPKHPDVEGAGRYVTPTNIMLARLPDFTAGGRFALGPQASRLEHLAYLAAQNAWKSTLGGAAQADTDTPSGDEAASRTASGAAEGLGTGLAITGGQAALRALPHWVMPAAFAGGELMHGHFMPWHIRHAIAAGLASIAARAARIPGGLMGAAGEAAAQKGGYEPGGGGEEQSPEPF